MMRLLGMFLLWLVLWACFMPVFSMLIIFPTTLLFGSGLVSQIAFWTTYPIAALAAFWVVTLLFRLGTKKPSPAEDLPPGE
jgi:hypothetical protein